MRRIALLAALSCAVALVGAPILADATREAAADPHLYERAEKLYEARDWAPAREAYAAITDSCPWNPALWYRLGVAEYRLGHGEAAAAAFGKARELGYRPFDTAYWLARTATLKGKRDLAMEWLEKGFATGAGDAKVVEQVKRDDAFATLRDLPRFAALVGRRLPEGISRVDGWRADLDALVSRLEETHYDLFHSVKPAAWHSAVETLRSRIPDLSDDEMIAELARLVAMVGDGHTVLDPSPPDERMHRLPLMLYWFSDGLFVRAAEDRDLVGRRVDAIGGVPVAEVLSRAARYISSDNEWQMRQLAPRYLVIREFLRTIGVAPDGGDGVSMTLDREGHVETVVVRARPLEALLAGASEYFERTPRFDERVAVPMWPNMRDGAKKPTPFWLVHPYEPWWFEIVPEAKLAYVQYNDVAEGPELDFDAFVDRLFARIDQEGVENLVVDIRMNSGGRTYQSVPLVQRIMAHPSINRHGHLFTIVGRRTNSSAMRFASQLEFWTETIFVGEPTGQGPNAYGGTNIFRLPYSGKSFRVANRFWIGGRTSDDDRRWIAPEIAAELSSHEFAANVDPAMTSILAYVTAR